MEQEQRVLETTADVELTHPATTAEICPHASEWAREAFARDVVYLLNEAAGSARSSVAAALGLVGVSARQMSIMRLLSLRSPIRQHDLGVLLGIDRTSMVALIDGLEGIGYVVREADPSDRRAHALRLTKAGLTANVDIGKAVDEAQNAILEPLTEDERALLVSLLTRLTSRDPITPAKAADQH